jgi:anti-anti-sigma factor
VQTQFRVEVKQDDRVAVIALFGELDLASSPALEDELARVFNSEAPTVVIDLRQLDFMDSTGLSILVRAHQRAIDSERRLALVTGRPQVQRLLTLTGVTERLSLVDVPEDALGGDRR